MSKRSIALAPVAAVLLGGVTALLLAWDWNGTRASEEFVESDRFWIWASLLCIQSAAWGVLLVVLRGRLRRLGRAFPAYRRRRRRIVLMSVAIVVLVGVYLAAYAPVAPYYPLTHRQLKLAAITAVGAIVALHAIVGMWMATAALEGLSPSRREAVLPAYLRLRDELRRFLGFAAAIVGAAMLSTGALRGAVLENVPGESFPPEYVLYYGAFFSAVIALAYAPAHFAFRDFGGKLLETLVPLRRGGGGSWAGWYDERRALEGFLGLDVATGRGLRSGLAIAAPFAGSAIGLLLGTSA